MYSVLGLDLGTACKFLHKNLTPFLRDNVERFADFNRISSVWAKYRYWQDIHDLGLENLLFAVFVLIS
jgi:hypothetical protein